MQCTSPFLYLTGSIRGADARQDAIVCLLQSQPKTEDEALLVLSRLHHRTEYATRKQRRLTRGTILQLSFDPCAPEDDPHDGPAMAALDLLPASNRKVIEQHVIEGLSFREIAATEGVSKVAIKKRFDIAAEKLRQLRESVNEQGWKPSVYK